MHGLKPHNSYRYAFQGQERDDEVKGAGNSYNYKYRMHDSRLGRFFAVDPLFKEYPHNSPYAFSQNEVTNAVELEGLEAHRFYECINILKSYSQQKTNQVKNFPKRTVVNLYKGHFDAQVSKNLIEHYGYGKGKEYSLTASEVNQVFGEAKRAKIGITEREFMEKGAMLNIGESREFSKSYSVYSDVMGALGSYTVTLKGEITSTSSGLIFNGVVELYDVYDFDSKELGVRKFESEMMTRIAGVTLPGKGFIVRGKYEIQIKEIEAQPNPDEKSTKEGSSFWDKYNNMKGESRSEYNPKSETITEGGGESTEESEF